MGRMAEMLTDVAQGATPRELLLEAARRDNTELLTSVLASNADADFLNNSTDALGNAAIHLAAQYGSCTPSPSQQPPPC